MKRLLITLILLCAVRCPAPTLKLIAPWDHEYGQPLFLREYPMVNPTNSSKQLTYTNKLGELEGGFAVLSPVTKSIKYVSVSVNARQEVLDAISGKAVDFTDQTAMTAEQAKQTSVLSVSKILASEPKSFVGTATCIMCGAKTACANPNICEKCATTLLKLGSIRDGEADAVEKPNEDPIKEEPKEEGSTEVIK